MTLDFNARLLIGLYIDGLGGGADTNESMLPFNCG